MTLQTQVVTITPERAAELLENNTVNRPPRGTAIKRYAEDMRKGRWHTNGEAIILREDGVLLNGQNRLMACVEAEVPFETLLVTGINGDVLDSIDIGQSRTLGDQLHWRGVSNASTIAAATKWALRYDLMVEQGTRQLAGYGASREVELAYFDEHRALLDASSATVLPLRRRIPGAQSVPLFVHFLLQRHAGLSKADDFYLSVGYDSETEDAASILKDWLLNHSTIGSRPPITVNAAIQVKAARFWLHDIVPTKLLWKRGGDKSMAEPFPRIEGEPWGKSTSDRKRRESGNGEENGE